METIVTYLAEHSWLTTCTICSLELLCAVITWKRLNMVRSIFPKNIIYLRSDKDSSFYAKYRSGRNSDSHTLNCLIDELNEYIRKNEGTTDFSIMQHKTERYLKVMFDDAVAMVSFPTYIGLMGTFLGVLIGLLCFAISDPGKDLVTDTKIVNLIHGVIISMSTSLIGLILTTCSNGYAAFVKKKLDTQKNLFYEFIQNELMPELGTSIVSALSKLRSTINKFEPSFNHVIDRFQDTFERCTSSFGNAFRENVLVVSKAVDAMGENISIINKNVENQQRLLDTLKSSEMLHVLKLFVSATHRFDHLSELMTQLYEVKENLVISTNQLINNQKSYNESLKVPRLVAERLNAILDRVVTFEQNIASLGNSISQTQLLGNSEMNLIKEQLLAIQRKHDIAMDYTETANDQLNDLYNRQVKTIEELNNRYSNAIVSHTEEFETMLQEISKRLRDKWNLFVGTLDNAFDVADIRVDFDYLKRLGSIDTRMATIEENMLNLKFVSPKPEELKMGTSSVANGDDKKGSINRGENRNHSSVEIDFISLKQKLEAISIISINGTWEERKKRFERENQKLQQLKMELKSLQLKDTDANLKNKITKLDYAIEEKMEQIIELQKGENKPSNSICGKVKRTLRLKK